MATSKTSPTAGETTDIADGVVGDSPVDTTEAEAPTVTDTAIIKMSDLEGVRYTGTADVKIFAAGDIDGIDTDLRWDRENGHFVPTSDITAAARDFLAAQPDFQLV